jgi:hypothetical protein
MRDNIVQLRGTAPSHVYAVHSFNGTSYAAFKFANSPLTPPLTDKKSFA